jgi:hypothetical protein
VPIIPEWTGKTSFSGTVPLGYLLNDRELNEPDISQNLPVWMGSNHTGKGMCVIDRLSATDSAIPYRLSYGRLCLPVC